LYIFNRKYTKSLRLLSLQLPNDVFYATAFGFGQHEDDKQGSTKARGRKDHHAAVHPDDGQKDWKELKSKKKKHSDFDFELEIVALTFTETKDTTQFSNITIAMTGPRI
jgi:hypothetical protein